jgi:hypothetical protein
MPARRLERTTVRATLEHRARCVRLTVHHGLVTRRASGSRPAVLISVVMVALTAACTKTVTVTVPNTTATTTSPTTSQSVTMVKVTGSPAIASSVTILDDGQESQHKDVALPYIVTLSKNPSTLRVTAESGSASTASITCEIDQPGRSVSDASSGAYAVVTCTT